MRRAPRYPVLVLGALAAVDAAFVYTYLVLGPDIGRSLGVGAGTITGLAVLQLGVLLLAALPLAILARRPVRGRAVAGAAGVLSAATAGTALVTGPWGLAGTVAARGASAASVPALHFALIADTYAPELRVRALALHRGLTVAGAALAAVGVALVTGPVGLTWRGAFLVLAGVALVAAIAAAWLRDQEGRDLRAIEPGMAGVAAQVLSAPTVRRIVAASAALGALAVPLSGYLFFFLEDRWDLGADGRAVFFAVAGALAIVALAVLAGEGERALRRGPAALLGATWPLVAVGALALVPAVLVPSFGVALALFGAVFAAVALAQTATTAALMTLVRPEHRAPAAALAGIAFAGIGGAQGIVLLAGAEENLDISGSIAACALPGVLAAVILRAAQSSAGVDFDMLAGALAEREQDMKLQQAGAKSPVLACRGITVEYGAERAVDGVDLELDEGELVVLLGTNGAGKTTLLRAISGLAPPVSGSVLFEGQDITWLEPERRVPLGIRHMAGGQSTFDSLTVLESARLAARAATGTSISPEQALTSFPALVERRNARASNLSAGERQMLGLVQTLIVRPRLLLVDELSLALAPVALDAVTDWVRELTNGGTAVLIADQSLDLALRLGGRSVFLERGRVRYDGPVAGLRGRRDLLRPVFLAERSP